MAEGHDAEKLRDIIESLRCGKQKKLDSNESDDDFQESFEELDQENGGTANPKLDTAHVNSEMEITTSTTRNKDDTVSETGSSSAVVAYMSIIATIGAVVIISIAAWRNKDFLLKKLKKQKIRFPGYNEVQTMSPEKTKARKLLQGRAKISTMTLTRNT
ncbi:ELL [Mytilus edulis]|uniref:ELL n=1 Tax=Mytilus edulis TaxID=6550 RepID=A0A8S3SYM6_MYTED|nr:ELL [Mytilus edulis]